MPRKTLRVVALALILIWTCFPIFWMLQMSFKTPKDVTHYPPKFIFKPTTANWENVLLGRKWTGTHYETVQMEVLRYFKNSLIIATGATLLALLLGLPAAYSLALYKFLRKEDFAFTLLSFKFAPALLVVFGLYAIYQKLKLYDSYIGLILIHQLILLPFVVWMMRSYFAAVPIEVEQAARVDGFSWWGVFTKITLPLVKPAIAATSVVAFIYSWNEFLFGYVLSGEFARPVTPSLLGFISYERVLWGQMAAAATLAMVPSVLLSLFIQRYVVAGLSFGAVRG